MVHGHAPLGMEQRAGSGEQNLRRVRAVSKKGMRRWRSSPSSQDWFREVTWFANACAPGQGGEWVPQTQAPPCARQTHSVRTPEGPQL